MSKIVYLFGAGASCQCLPIVKDMPERMKAFIDCLKSEEFKLPDNASFSFSQLSKFQQQKDLIEAINDLIAKSSKHASVDTYAKKLSIKGHSKELNRLKLCLSAFLIYEQIKNPPDSRYDTFFASLLNDHITNFPKNIRILTWNYDYQFEISFMEYSGDYRHWASRHTLNVVSKYNNTARADNFSILKLNGTAGLTDNRTHYCFIDDFQGPLTIDTIERLVKMYASGLYQSNIVFSSLSFAWENEYRGKSIVQESMESTNDADVLVIIGYSFPFFNREIDRKIIGNMKNLKKVYFQDLTSKNIIERFKAIRADYETINIVPYNDVNQFLLPDEL